MAAFISRKLSLVLLLFAWCAAGGIIFLTQHALTGPKLGPAYDFLLGFRPSPPVAWEIVLIETDEVIEPGDIFPVLMTLSEMGASNLLIEVPVLGGGSGRTENPLELSYRVNDEFSLLEKNIRGLFDGIRLGLVAPAESPGYVDDLIGLAERGRDRLNSAIVRQDEAGSALAAQAAAVFGNSITAADLRMYGPAELLQGIPWYSRPNLDGDRILRRVAPVRETDAQTEHIVYYALKPRWEKSAIEHTETGKIMVNRFERQGEEIEFRFTLDTDGNILFEKPGKNNDFRRLSLEQFRSYEQANWAMARLLKDAESLGVYSETIPERIPFILFEYAESLKEELLKPPGDGETPTRQRLADWVNARAEYIACLDEFLYSPSEMIMVNRYEELIAAEWLDTEGITRLQSLRDELIQAFVAMREKHRELADLRALLAEAVNSAFCIMGPGVKPAVSPEVSNIPEASALLANTLLTGRYITPGEEKHVLFFSGAASLLALLFIHALRPAALFIAGFVVSLLCGAAFGTGFIVTGYWIDPFIPMAACLGGTLFLTVSRFCISFGRTMRFRLAYTGSVSNSMLRQMLKLGRPPLSETQVANAVIIAVKKAGMASREDQGTPLEAAKAAAVFRQESSSIFRKNGAVILGFENDIALACFGSPPQQLCEKDDIDLMTRATAAIREILGHPASATWQFGIESGKCAFSWSWKTGYTANGRAVVRARVFTMLASRHHVRAVIGKSAWESSDLLMKKISSYAGEDFYELLI